MPRRGFTLVELLIAVVICGVVATAINKVLTAQQRLAVAQAEQAALQANVRSGSMIAASELFELARSTAGVSDISAFDSAGLTYRAMRSLGLACQVSRTEIRLRTSTLYKYRSIVPGQDSILLWVEGNPDISADDKWLPLRVSAVVSGSTCGPDSAIALTIHPIDTLTTPLSSIVTDAPARTFEVMELRAVTVGGQNWLGARSVSGGQAVLIPVAGPLTGNGISFAYLDSLGAATGAVANIRSIRITVRGESDVAVRSMTSPAAVKLQDSLTTTITLRNTPGN